MWENITFCTVKICSILKDYKGTWERNLAFRVKNKSSKGKLKRFNQQTPKIWVLNQFSLWEEWKTHKIASAYVIKK